MTILLVLVALICLIPMALLVLIPVGFGLQGLQNMVTVPRQLVGLLRDVRRRRNHALEHATVNVLEERFRVRGQLSGMAEADGFHIFGPVPAEQVLSAAREGLARLQRGERQLAVHPRSPMTLFSGFGLAALTLLGLVGATGRFSLGWLFVALFVAWALARPVSLWMQRLLTRRTDVQAMQVETVQAEMPTTPIALLVGGGRLTHFKVLTRQRATPPTMVTPDNGGQRRYRGY